MDAYNNTGLLKIYLEDYIEAERVLQDGLRICYNEEVADNDDGRTRLHHNLGRIYMEIKEWEKANEHINIDIEICQNIPHPQGESKGLINLGLIHYKLQKYDDALLCYKRALRIASKLEDEDALVKSIRLNIESTEEAQKIMSELVQEEQQLKKLARNASLALDDVSPRKHCIKLHKFLKQIIDLAINIGAWPKYLEYAKKAKNVVKRLRDMEKLSDAFLDIGEAYYNLREFDKAKKWHMKSWKASNILHNLKICQCPVSLSRLEVLNLAGNRLTDASACHLSTFIKGCKALAILNLEGCSLTSRMIRRISNALPLESGLVKLSIGKNHNYGNCISDLLRKLSKLESFSDLDLTNVDLNKKSIDSLCHLQTSSSIASLVIQGTNIGKDGALKLSETLAERAMTVTVVDMSFCGIGNGGEKLFNNFSLHKGLLQLYLSGNPVEEREVNALGYFLGNAQCHLKCLMVNKWSLGQSGVLKIIKALPENRTLQELGLAGNTVVGDDTIFNIVGGADRTNTTYCGEEVVTINNSHGEYSEIRTRGKSIEIEIPIVMECVEFLDRAKNEYHSPEGRMCHSIPTEFNSNGTKACTKDKIVSIEQHSQQSFKKHGRNHNEYDVADSEDEEGPQGVNCFSLEEDCASSSRSLGLVRGRSHQLLDFQSSKSASSKGETKSNIISLMEYAPELFSAIGMAKYLQLLDPSDNLLTSEIVEQLYVAWSSNTRAVLQ